MLKYITELQPGAVTLGAKIISRGKRTMRQAPGASRVVNMLSVLSARKKQPRRLKLCKEDLVRHQVVTAAWKIHQKNEQASRRERLAQQFEKIQTACSELERLDPQLFAAANVRKNDTRFPLELRTPTDTPPRIPWEHEWTPPARKN